MHEIVDTITIDSTPARLLEALTSKDGIRGWWTTDVDCDLAKREATFRFAKEGGVMTTTFRLDGADERAVTMTCIGGNNVDWLGTKLELKLVADGARTRVDLVHAGYPAKNEVYAMCTKGWTFFLGSLKSYLETGKGQPHEKPAAA